MFGDIIYVERKPILLGSTKVRENEYSKWIDKLIFRTMSYRHFGIEVENNYVIHFHANSFHMRKHAEIKKVSMETFLLGGEKVIMHHIKDSYARERIVTRAYSALGKREECYSINKNNCEHFVYWCATGNPYSTQTYFINKGQDVWMLRKKVVPFTVKTKNRTLRLSMDIYKRILRRA